MAIANTSMKARFEDVRYDIPAVKFHAVKFESGSTYPLAKQCFQLWQTLKNRTAYEVYTDETEGKYNGNNS